MRKVVSLILVAATLLCSMMIAPAAVSAATLDSAGNVSAEAYYYGGKVSVREAYGDCAMGDDNPLTFVDEETVIRDGDASKGSIVLDGTIKKGEWGDPVVVVDSKYAPHNNGQEYTLNPEYETPSAENTYYYYKVDGNRNSLAPKQGLKFELYMMWDEDYMYVAAKTTDNDQHNSGNNTVDLWDADSFQFRVDTKGPNSAVGGEGYDAKGMPDAEEPWADMVYDSRRWCVQERVCNLVFTYTSSGGGLTEKWDASLRYQPEYKDGYVDANGDPLLVYNQHDVSDYYFADWGLGNNDNLPGTEGVYGMAYPKMTGIAANAKYTTTYEFAIPWSVIDANYTPEIGSELGVVATLLNAAPGGKHNSALTWGTGVLRHQIRWNPQTAGGSNSVILSDKAYTTARCTHEKFAAATCIAPETCENCGYQRGYKAGHKNEYSDMILPTATEDGSVTSTCKVCHNEETQTIPKANSNMIYNFNTESTTVVDDKGFDNGVTADWKTSTKTDDNGNSLGLTILDDKGKNKNAYDDVTFPELGAVLDLYSNGSRYAAVDEDMTNGSQTGTYFSLAEGPSTYMYKMDVMFPSLEDQRDDGYRAGLRNWVGNPTKYGFYGAGLYKVDDKYYFAIITNSYGEGNNTMELFEKNALMYVPATESDLETNKWHTYAFAFDEATGTAMFAWDGVLKVYANDYHLKYLASDNQAICFFRRFNMGLYVKDVEYGGLGLFSNYAAVPGAAYKVTVNDTEIGKFEKDATVSYSTPKTITEDGQTKVFVKWTGDVSCLEDVTATEGTFTMPGHRVTLTAEYRTLGDISGSGAATAEDSILLKQMLAGKIEATEAADVNGDGAVNTKDAFMLKQILAGDYTYEE